MATIAAAAATQAEIDRLAEHYAVRDPAAVAAFVRDHPEVVAPLLEAVAVVPRYSGPDAALALEVERDPEDDDHTLLFALILTVLSVDEALAAVDRFDEEWWLDAMGQAGTKLAFGPEYV